MYLVMQSFNQWLLKFINSIIIFQSFNLEAPIKTQYFKILHFLLSIQKLVHKIKKNKTIQKVDFFKYHDLTDN